MWRTDSDRAPMIKYLDSLCRLTLLIFICSFFLFAKTSNKLAMYENEIQTDLDFEKFISRFFRVCLPFYKKTHHTHS